MYNIFIILLIVTTFTCKIDGKINTNGKNWALWCEINSVHSEDLISEQISGEECGGRCWNIRECTHFNWTDYDGGTCWLKRGRVTMDNDAIPKRDENAVCGVLRPASRVRPTRRMSDNDELYNKVFN